jgi:hypothetical protein
MTVVPRPPEERHPDDVLERLWAYFGNFGALEDHIFDTSDQHPEDTVDAIHRRYRAGVLRLS